MDGYTRILVATDLAPDSATIMRRAVSLARCFEARLSLIHVVERLPADIPTDLVPSEHQDKLDYALQEARAQVEALASGFGMARADCWVTHGDVDREIAAHARQARADLVVVGAHERHGLALLRGPTADGVVHRAPCDVLVIHVAGE